MTTTLGKLRNVTSGRLHTSMNDVYEFYTQYIGFEGIMTHHLPSAFKALLPILKTKLPDYWFTDEWIKEGLDEKVMVPELSEDERSQFWISFKEYAAHIWDSLGDKTLVVTLPG